MGLWGVQLRMVIATKLHACNALVWLVVEAAWVRRTAEGRPYGIAEDLLLYYGLGILPAVIAGWLFECRTRHRFLQRHQ